MGNNMQRDELEKYLNEYLNTADFKDHGPNGLQVEGRSAVKKIVTGVSASVELIESALSQAADALIVHHGIIWDFERPVYRGGYKRRVKLLLENDLSLFAFHLPLDAHKEVGNNFRIANILGLEQLETFGEYNSQPIGCKGSQKIIEPEKFFALIREKINTKALIFPYGPDRIRSVGVVSGGAQKEVRQALNHGLDLYLTGEASEYNMHIAKEERIHFVAAGHHATERFGIQALGEHLQNRFDVSVEFIDIPNPV